MKERLSAIKPYILKHKNIADLGIGKGYYYSRLDLSDKNIVGVDLNKSNLKKTKDFYPTINILVRDIRDTGLEDNAYDLVIMSQVIEHLEDYEPALKEAKRICKSGGYFLIATPTEDYSKLHFHPVWTEEKIREIGNRMGDIITIRKGENWWMVYVRNIVIPEEDYLEDIKEFIK